MAKQLGIHQIRGKVGGRSYYKTKGVEDGISRSINPGMSARVKNGDEYANTRLNNAEFGNANKIATAAFNSVNTRKRGMMLNFAIAAMTKVALEDIKQGTGVWGARKPATVLDSLICDLLEKHAKGGSYDNMFGVATVEPLTSTGSVSITFDVDAAQVNALLDLGIDGFQIITSKCLAGEILVDGAPRLYAGHALNVQPPLALERGTDATVEIVISVADPVNVGMSPSGFTFAQEDPNHGFYAVCTFLPFRQHGASRYTLQEYCTYVAIPLGQIPEE